MSYSTDFDDITTVRIPYETVRELLATIGGDEDDAETWERDRLAEDNEERDWDETEEPTVTELPSTF